MLLRQWYHMRQVNLMLSRSLQCLRSDLTWPNTDDTFKVSEIEKAQRQAINASLKQTSKMKRVFSDQIRQEVEVLKKKAQASISQQRTPKVKARIVVNLRKLKSMPF